MKSAVRIASRLTPSLRASTASPISGPSQVRHSSPTARAKCVARSATAPALPQTKQLSPIQRRLASTSTRAASASNGKMAENLAAALTPACLKEIRDFWFEHLPDKNEFVVPGQTANARWWMGGESFDEACASRFAPTLEAIQASGITSGGDLLEACPPQEPCDWLSLILLLDQLSRNSYRGAASATVFRTFDPLAEEVAQAAIAAGIPDEEPEVRWRFAYRLWFYMPLMHSEKLAVHELAVRKFEQLAADVEALLADEGGGGGDGKHEGEWQAKAREVVRADGEAARGFVNQQLEFERRHQAVIARFGRYPHRNAPLGRENTEEEEAYLASGGETFAADKEEQKKE